MSLSKARTLAEEVKQVLSPYCERLEVAGSIRRGKQEVKDIELVAVPPTCDLLTSRMLKDDPEKETKAKNIADRFTRGYPQHGYPIDMTEANRLGLRVERMPPEQWEKVWKIWALFNENFN